MDVFRQELSNLGWIEGKSIATEYRFSQGRDDRLPELAADLVRLKVDLLVVAGTTAAAAKKATTTIPIVITNAGDPVGAGLVASLARPGGNITGLSSLSTQLNTKRLEVLKDTVPQLSRVGLLVPAGRTSAGAVLQRKEIRTAALALKLKLEEIETQLDANGLQSAFQAAKQTKVGAITTTSARPFSAERKRIVDLAVKYGLPGIYFEKEFVEEGGLMSYGRISKICFASPPITLTRSSRELNLPTCRYSSPRSLSSSLISKPPSRSVSRFRPTCWRGRTGRSNETKAENHSVQSSCYVLLA